MVGMANENVRIVLNQEIAQQLHLEKGQVVEAELDVNRLLIQTGEEPKRQTLSSWVVIVATLVLCSLFYALSALQNRNQILLVGDYSIITFLIAFSGVLGMTVFTINLIRNRQLFLGGLKARVFWRMLPIMRFTTSLRPTTMHSLRARVTPV